MTLISLSPEKLDANVPTPMKLVSEHPLSETDTSFIQQSRQQVRSILQGLDSRLLMIIGPCSIHHPKSIYEYAKKFLKLAEEVSDRFFLIMRAYYEKPRTTRGWKGLVFDPHLDGSYDISTGLRVTRKLLVDLTTMGVPFGCEFLEIHTTHYFDDLVTWGCIGARTSSSQPHRQLASGLPIPVGFKNSTDGNVDHAIHGVVSASTPHAFLGCDHNGQIAKIFTAGNPYCHVVLRGGQAKPNYDPVSVAKTIEKCRVANIRSKILIDCSHDNCGKKHEKQIPAFRSVIDQIAKGNRSIVGLMMESHLSAGRESVSLPAPYGTSITDPCLDWSTTESLIKEAYQKLENPRF